MALTADEKKALDALLAKEKEDDDDDYEIEIWSGDKGARVPYRKGKAWFEETFGAVKLNAEPKAPATRGRQAKQDPAKSDDESAESGEETTVLRHFRSTKAS